MNKDFEKALIVIAIILSLFAWDSLMDKYTQYSNNLPAYECNYTQGITKVSDVYKPDDFNECEIIKHIPFLNSAYKHCSEQHNNLKQMYEEGKCSKIYSKKLQYENGSCELNYTIQNGKQNQRGCSGSNLDMDLFEDCCKQLEKQLSLQ